MDSVTQNHQTNPRDTLLYHVYRANVKVLGTSMLGMASQHVSKQQNTPEHPDNTKG